MSGSGLGERLLSARLASERLWQAAGGLMAGMPIVGGRLMRGKADEFLFIPSDMRPRDPALLDEIRSGQLGLAGIVVEIRGGSPFAIKEAPRAWARELHGFDWLGSLREAGGAEAVVIARQLVEDWCGRRLKDVDVASEPYVAARRVVSWIANAGFLLEDVDARFYSLFTQRLGRELRRVDLASRRTHPGYPLLACRLALVLASLALAGHDGERQRLEAALLGELGRQVLADGGHASRNPETVVEILLDLLPIRQCYTSRGLEIPAGLASSIAAMLAHLRAMLLGPAELAHFNGVTSANAEALATVLAVDAAGPSPGTRAPGASGYARLEAGETTVIADFGRPPPLLLSGSAHAGCLSFELAHLGEALIVNCGAPASPHTSAAPDARATASHSTLVIAEQSSARLVRSERIEHASGGIPLAGLDVSGVRLEEPDPGSATLIAIHSGYLERTGLVHERRVTLSADGRRCTGVDILRPPSGMLRLAKDLPVAIHFHLAQSAEARAEADGSVLVAQANGARWRLSAGGSRLVIEAATNYSNRLGPAPARQIVLRTTTPGESQFEWCLECL